MAGSDEYPPTPGRLQALVAIDHLVCRVCHFRALKQDLNPILGLLCPVCFRRWAALNHVPFLEVERVAVPLIPADKHPGALEPKAVERLSTRLKRGFATTKLFKPLVRWWHKNRR